MWTINPVVTSRSLFRVITWSFQDFPKKALVKKPKGMSRELYDLLIRQGQEDKVVSYMQSGMATGYSSVKAQVRRGSGSFPRGPTARCSTALRRWTLGPQLHASGPQFRPWTSILCPTDLTAKLLWIFHAFLSPIAFTVIILLSFGPLQNPLHLSGKFAL